MVNGGRPDPWGLFFLLVTLGGWSGRSRLDKTGGLDIWAVMESYAKQHKQEPLICDRCIPAILPQPGLQAML